MPFKSGNLVGKLTRQELIDKYSDNFEKMGKFWSRKEIIEKLHSKGVSVEGEEDVVQQIVPDEEEVVEEEVVEEEVVEEVKEEVIEEVKSAPKKKGRPKKHKKN